MKSGFLKRLLDRAEKIDKDSILDYLKQMAQERNLLVHIFDSMCEGILFIDDEEIVVYVNQSARRILGLSDGTNTPAQPLSRLLSNADLYARLREAPKNEDAKDYRDFSLEINDENRFLKIKTVPLQNRDAVFGTLFLFLDETEQRQQQKKLREAEKLAALTTLAAGVSHEIRNPLNSLSIHLQLLQRRLKKNRKRDSETEEVLQIFQTEIKRLNEVIETFLAAVRPSAPQMRLTRLYTLITEPLNLMEPEFRENHIQVILHEEGEWPLIHADETQIKQAVINILRNAIEAIAIQNQEERAEKENKVFIHMTRFDDQVSVTFIDDGRGMDEQEARRLFEPYFTTKPKGSGLGMMIVERIIREHRGTISAHSSPGEGARIRITLPVAAEEPRLIEHDANGSSEQSIYPASPK